MSLHSSLKTNAGALSQHRNVLTRAERITKLQDENDFVVGESSPLGIRKVRSIMVTVKKKPTKGPDADKEDADATE
ncbi:MAG: small basic protein [Phycisphaerales bacterium]|jgi:small basic protein (TIGR04137 family)|nr:small basic protein [Phycisphaerales bacterium]